MAKVSSSAMWSAIGMANVQASAIPAYLKDKVFMMARLS